MREGLTRTWRRVARSLGAVLGILTIAAIAIGFSGQILSNPAAGESAAPTLEPGATEPVRPTAGVRGSPDPAVATACTRNVSVDASGRDDVTAALQAFVNASPKDSVICFARGGSYRMEGKLHLEARDDLTFDGRGARLFATQRSADPRILIDKGGSNIWIHDLTIEGWWPEAGTPDTAIAAFQGNHGIAIGGAENVEIGPNVTIRNVGGDGVYMTAGSTGGTQRWADGIRVHDSTIERNGRMGVAITDGARNVVVEHNQLDEIALYAFDIEPNAEVFDGVPAGAEHVRFTNNEIGTYGLSPDLVPWLFAGTGDGPQTDIDVSYNVSTAGPLRMAAWNVKESGRKDFRFLGNWSDTSVVGPVMEFDGIDQLEVRDTHQPLTFGRLAKVTNSTVIGDID
jgi:hypothetical protein